MKMEFYRVKHYNSRKLRRAIFENHSRKSQLHFQKDEKQKRMRTGKKRYHINVSRAQNVNLENILETRGGRVPKWKQTSHKTLMTVSRSANLEKILKTRGINSGAS